MDSAFLFGGGIAFLIALLAWADQIGGAQDKSRAREREFLETSGTRWRDLAAVIRADDVHEPGERLLAVLRLRKTGALSDGTDVRLLELFEHADARRAWLENAYTTRYWWIFSTTGALFILGILALFLQGPVKCGSKITWSYVWAAVAALLITGILLLTGIVTSTEAAFRKDINDMEDEIRLTKDRGQRKGM
jgi:hypothetical protein